jgi:hypothetical protein
MGHEGPEAHRSVHLQGVEPGDTLEADHMARGQPATVDLHDEIGPAGEETTIGPEPRGKVDCLAH